MASGVVLQRHPRPSASAGGVWSRLPSPSLALPRVMAVVRPASPIHSLRRSSAARRGNEAWSWLLAAAEYATRSPTLKLTNPRAFCFGKPGSSRCDVGKPFVKCPDS